MSAHLVVADALLVAGVAAELLCVLGVCWMRSTFDKLHFAAAASTLGPVLVAVATVLVGFSSPSATIQCAVALAAIVLLNPVLTHATGRLAWEIEVRGESPDETPSERGSTG